MILIGEKLNTLNKTCPNTSVSTTNLTRTGLESNPCLRGVRPANRRLGKGSGVRRRRKVEEEDSVVIPHVFIVLPINMCWRR
jgi:hypothetical protein